MKKLPLALIFLALAIAVPIPTMADVNISIGFPLPPPVVYAAPPEVIAVPEAHEVYVVPDINVDIFFWNGWWWRPWEGRWYCSRYYNRGWVYYGSVPFFYYDIDPGWRGHYRDHDWYGRRWNYERISHDRLQKNWKSWYANRYWEKQRSWGVENYRARPQKQIQELRYQREKQYQQRPEVQRYQQQSQAQQRPRGPQVRQPQQRQFPQQQHSQGWR